MSSKNFESFNPQDYTVNYDNIAKHKNLCNTTRVLAMDLVENPYIMVGDFFKGLSDSSLDELLGIINRDDEDAVSETLLLTEMLSRAEGVENELDDMARNIGMMRMFVAGVSLARKGLIKVYYENMSFGSETSDKILFEKINNAD